jgi:hypothetical protein
VRGSDSLAERAFRSSTADADRALSPSAARYLASLQAATLAPLVELPGVDLAGGSLVALQAATDGLHGLSAASWGLQATLGKAWLLGDASRQPAAAGGDTGRQPFDYWEDSLAL